MFLVIFLTIDGINGKTEIWDWFSAHVQNSESTSIPWIRICHDRLICCLWPDHKWSICCHSCLCTNRLGHSSCKFISSYVKRIIIPVPFSCFFSTKLPEWNKNVFIVMSLQLCICMFYKFFLRACNHYDNFVTSFFLHVQRLAKHAGLVLRGLEFGIQWWSWHEHTNVSWDCSYSRQLWSCLGSHSYQSSRRGCSLTRLSVEVSRFQWSLQGRKRNHQNKILKFLLPLV